MTFLPAVPATRAPLRAVSPLGPVSLLASAALALFFLTAAPAEAATMFTIERSSSILAVTNATFQTTAVPPFVTDIVPAAPNTFARLVDGTVVADPTTGAIASADLVVFGFPFMGDQIRLDSRGNPRDLGDFLLGGLTLGIDDLGNATITGGSIEYDLSKGSSRIVTTNPIDLVGDAAGFANTGGPPVFDMVGGLDRVSVPVLVDFVDLPAVPGGTVSFTISGTIVAVVPEPGTAGLLGLGLGTLGWLGRRRTREPRRPRSVPRLFALLALLVVPLAGCPDIDDEDETPLPFVDAMDDSASTATDRSVDIAVLANDMQDDDLVDDFSQPVDQLGNAQPGSVSNTFLFYPDRLTYTPPAGFVGVVTFTYDIVGLGVSYDFDSSDTATVTVTVTPGLPDVDAVDDVATTPQDQQVIIDVLANDSEDADAIFDFTDAMEADGTVQAGSVTLVPGAVEMLAYKPPPGFSGSVEFDYTIEGAGVSFTLGSQDTATVVVDVEAPTSVAARVQFQENITGLEFVEVSDFFVGQANIDNGLPSSTLFQPDKISACVDVTAGVDVALRAEVLGDILLVIDGVCPLFEGGVDYTVIARDDGAGGVEVVCVEGLADSSLCP